MAYKRRVPSRSLAPPVGCGLRLELGCSCRHKRKKRNSCTQKHSHSHSHSSTRTLAQLDCQQQKQAKGLAPTAAVGSLPIHAAPAPVAGVHTHSGDMSNRRAANPARDSARTCKCSTRFSQSLSLVFSFSLQFACRCEQH